MKEKFRSKNISVDDLNHLRELLRNAKYFYLSMIKNEEVVAGIFSDKISNIELCGKLFFVTLGYGGWDNKKTFIGVYCDTIKLDILKQ